MVGAQAPIPTEQEIDAPHCYTSDYLDLELDFNPTLGEIAEAGGDVFDGFGIADGSLPDE